MNRLGSILACIIKSTKKKVQFSSVQYRMRGKMNALRKPAILDTGGHGESIELK
jgi:hypothetical protein